MTTTVSAPTLPADAASPPLVPTHYPSYRHLDPHRSVVPLLRTPEARARFLSRALIGTTLHFTPCSRCGWAADCTAWNASRPPSTP